MNLLDLADNFKELGLDAMTDEEIADLFYWPMDGTPPEQRLGLFCDIFASKLPRKAAARIVAEHWTSSDIGKRTNDEKRRILDLLSEADWDDWSVSTYKALPDTVPVYRGTRGRRKNSKGVYWSLSKERAKVFALCTLTEGWVYSGTVPKGRIVYMTNERKEQEVVCRPGDVIIDSCEYVRYEPQKN